MFAKYVNVATGFANLHKGNNHHIISLYATF